MKDAKHLHAVVTWDVQMDDAVIAVDHFTKCLVANLGHDSP